MKEKIKIGYIGLGRRGTGVLKANLVDMSDIEIAYVCDLSEKRMEAARDIVIEKMGTTPIMTADYHDILRDPTVDAVFIMTNWYGRPEIAMEAMRAGKYTAFEVGCAENINICYDLVKTYEETKTPIMMLENCCYGRREMMILNIVKQGLFGEIIHAEGAYIHNLDPFWKEYHSNWRLRYNATHRGDVYPTHGIGPVCQALDIHRGDKMDYLVSMDTKSVHGKAIAQEQLSAEERAELGIGADDFANGDHVATLIRTAKGKQIEIQHNV